MVTVIMNSYKEKENLFRRAIKSIPCNEIPQIILSTVTGDPCIGWAKDYEVDIVTVDKPGITVQLNNAYPHIRGDYVCYCSSNDMMFPNKLYLETQLLKESGKKVCNSAFRVNDKRTQKLPLVYNYKQHLKGNFVSDCSMVEAKTFLKYMPFDERFYELQYYDLWLRIYEGEGDVFVYNPIPTWNYRVSSNSRSVKRKKSPEMQKTRQGEMILLRKLHNERN